jgi:ankyrin repeat protein
MHLACSAGHANVVASLLLSGADVNRPDGVSAQPLHHFLSLFIRSSADSLRGLLLICVAFIEIEMRQPARAFSICHLKTGSQPHKEMQHQINYAFLNLLRCGEAAWNK